MKAGFSRVSITPKNGTPMVGYYEERYSEGALDDIYLTAVAFEEEGVRALIYSIEVCELSTPQCTSFRKAVSDATGVALDAIFINCSHTHTGPMVGLVGALGTTMKNPELEEELYDIFVKVGKDAIQDLADGRFYYSENEAKGISFIRRYRMKNGGVQTNPGVFNPDIDHPLGTPNEKAKMIRIEREDKESIAIISYGTHADSVGSNLISGDYPGLTRNLCESTLPNTKCIFLTGAQGDVNHINVNPTPEEDARFSRKDFDCPRGYEHTKFMAKTIIDALMAARESEKEISTNKLNFGSKEFFVPSNQENHKLDEARQIVKLYNENRKDEIPFTGMELTTVIAEACRIVRLENGPDGYTFRVFMLSLGGMSFVGIPGELFTEVGRRAEAISKSEVTFILCLTNGGDSYFPTSSAYDEGGYEARTSKLKKGVDNIVIDTLKKLYGEVNG